MKRWCIALFVALAASLCVPAAAEPLRLAVSSGTVSLPIYVARAKHFFESEGLELAFVECSSGRECYRMLLEGKADVATAAELVVALDSTTRDDLAIIGTISASSNQLKLVARRSAGIRAPADLRGKRVGTVFSSSAEYFLSTWLLFHDVSPAELDIANIAPARLAGELQSGALDAIAIWEPAAGMAVKALGADAIQLPVPRVYTQFFNLVTLRTHVKAHRASLRRLLAALARAENTITHEPGFARQVLMKQLGVDEASATEQLAEHDFRLRLDQALVSTMSSERRWAARNKAGMAGALPDGRLLPIDPELLQSLIPGAVSFVH